ncbi:MAG: PilZ domain-containing protein [Thiohalocapsa sp.]|nr:PilZ domain-containing protein [Thiohalocapsa sp.]
MMEHRWHSRVSIALPVGLHFGDGAYAWGTAVDIGGGGMYIRTAMRPQRNGCVDIRMTVPCSFGECSIRLPSMIVHRNQDGVGLMFRDLDEQAEEAVRQLLRGEARRRPPTPLQQPMTERHKATAPRR